MRGRILFLVSGLGVGGAELHTIGLRAGLDQDMQIGLTAYGNRRAEVVLSRPGAEGAVFLDFRGMSSFGGWWRLWRHLRQENPDLIVAVNQAPLIGAVVARWLRATRARIACIYHTTILRPGDERNQELFRLGLRHADALVYVSSRQAAYWRERGLACRRETVIHNGVDLDFFRPCPDARAATRAQLGLCEGDLVVGMVASFWAEKNHLAVVEAVAALRLSGVPARIIFVGDGPMRGEILRRAAELDLEAALTVIGEVADVRPYIAAFDVGVIASTAVETFSLSALECLAGGVPMVMSEIGGAAEIIEDGVNGLLVPAGDQAALTAALTRMTDSGFRHQLATAARPSIERYGLPKMLAGYRTLFAGLLP